MFQKGNYLQKILSFNPSAFFGDVLQRWSPCIAIIRVRRWRSLLRACPKLPHRGPAAAENMDDKGDSTIMTYDREPVVEMSSSVPIRYRGTAADARDMKILGKTQVLRVMRRAGRRSLRALLKADGGTA